jgi:hypothetical protein
VEIIFKLLYEETNTEVKVNDQLTEDMIAVRYDTNLKGCGNTEGSYFIIQNAHISGKLRIHMCVMECVESAVITERFTTMQPFHKVSTNAILRYHLTPHLTIFVCCKICQTSHG